MQTTLWERARDTWLFQRRAEDGAVEVTAGTIVYGAVVRAFAIVVGSLTLASLLPDVWRYWWIVLLALWAVVFYPAYRRWSQFTQEVRQLREELLCGSCCHFDETGQLCTLLDEHVRPDYIPCGGEAWEPCDTSEK
ncbi:MAG: hypothetical protein NZ960_06790 [Candidatus Kapabacteria bacterium]|nr:hypothetical protein [Candidatus Kapabacteria bacterium]MDW8012724.1 hypothetical protein [Bacteroidota bacterium]